MKVDLKKVFISYSDDDRSKMRSLGKIITNSARFNPIVVADRRDAFTALTDKVKQGIFECDYFVPLFTKSSIFSQWVNQEIGFAAALNKKIVPIVDRELIDKLKGFIHKNIDLPYLYSDIPAAPKKNRAAFRKACNLLVNDLMLSNNFSVKSLELENIFPGKWVSEYHSSRLSGKEGNIEIVEGNRYLVNGHHLFNIEKFKMSSQGKKISFVKVGLGNDKRRIFNKLDVLKLGEVYTGIEKEASENIEIRITYSKV